MERACHWSTPGLGEGGHLTVRGREGRAGPPYGRHQGGQPVDSVHQVGAGVADLGQVGGGGTATFFRRGECMNPMARVPPSYRVPGTGWLRFRNKIYKDHSYLWFP